jgi:hypothetical protein
MAADSEPQIDKIEPSAPTKIPFWRLVFDQGVVTQEIIDHPYPGSGTDEDPFAVTWIPDDPRNPMNFSEVKKWTFTMIVAIATLAVSLVSSAYTGGIQEIMMQFNIGQELATLGVSLFVLGFAVSPPLSSHWLSSLRNLLDMHTDVIFLGIDRTIALGPTE